MAKYVSDANLQYFKEKLDAQYDALYLKDADLPTNVSDLTNDAGYQTAENVQQSINTALSAVMTYKGTKATVGELPTSDQKLGDVWHVTADGNEYAWNGTSWEMLGSTVELTWEAITGKPSTFTPAAHTHVIADITDLQNASTTVAGLMSAADKSKLDGIAAGANNYEHPTVSQAYASGLYKITTNDTGHVTAATAVVKTDITALGIPAQDTTYTEATASQAGLLSAADKAKLDKLEEMTALTTTEIDAMF